MEVCEERRADPPLPQAHRCQALQVPQLRSLLLEVRSPGAPHENKENITTQAQRWKFKLSDSDWYLCCHYCRRYRFRYRMVIVVIVSIANSICFNALLSVSLSYSSLIAFPHSHLAFSGKFWTNSKNCVQFTKAKRFL